jgi:hypothetical protein
MILRSRGSNGKRKWQKVERKNASGGSTVVKGQFVSYINIVYGKNIERKRKISLSISMPVVVV